MLGAIIGDIVGSRFDGLDIKSKDFTLFTSRCTMTDDSIMTLAIAEAILSCRGDYTLLGKCAVAHMQRLGRLYPNCGYAELFSRWIHSDDPRPYGSYGNGSAMRVSPCAYVASSLEEALHLCRTVTEVTHNSDEGIRGAEAVTAAIYMARNGSDIANIQEHIHKNYYPMDFTLDGIRDTYTFDMSCAGSVPQAIMAFLESDSFEDAIRNAVSLGGDSDTIGAITGSIAEAYYGIPEKIRAIAMLFMDERQIAILNEFESNFPFEPGIKHPKSLP